MSLFLCDRKKELMNMRLLASDYDGTLRYAKHVMQEDLDAIHKWKEQGNLFAIITGRPFDSIIENIKEYDLPCDFIVTNNGAMVYDGLGNELMASHLDLEACKEVVSLAENAENVAGYFLNDGKSRHCCTIDSNIMLARYPKIDCKYLECHDYILDKVQSISQIVISTDTSQTASYLENVVNSNFNEVDAFANRADVDIVPSGISKATGLEFIMEYENLKEENVYAIGDARNDIPMIKFAWHGMSMDTADEEVQMFSENTYSSIKELIEDIM